jgi:hypothetical protein
MRSAEPVQLATQVQHQDGVIGDSIGEKIFVHIILFFDKSSNFDQEPREDSLARHRTQHLAWRRRIAIVSPEQDRIDPTLCHHQLQQHD